MRAKALTDAISRFQKWLAHTRTHVYRLTMAAVSGPAIQRFSVAGDLPYGRVERMTGPLISVDRWPSRARRDMRASDLGSLLNAIAGAQTTEGAAETDTMLRGLEFKSALPSTADQAPMFGVRLWGELLDGLIENAPELLDYSPHTSQDMPKGSACLPDLIEVSTSPLLVVLVWLDDAGVPKRREFYSTTRDYRENQKASHESHQLLVRKSFLDGKMISLAGEILRDCTTRSPKTTTAAEAPPSRGRQSKATQTARRQPKPLNKAQVTRTLTSASKPRVRSGIPAAFTRTSDS